MRTTHRNYAPKRMHKREPTWGALRGALGGHSFCDFARRSGFRGALALALAFARVWKKQRRPRFRGAFNPTEYTIYNTKGPGQLLLSLCAPPRSLSNTGFLRIVYVIVGCLLLRIIHLCLRCLQPCRRGEPNRQTATTQPISTFRILRHQQMSTTT